MKFLASFIIIASLITTQSWGAAKQCRILVGEAAKAEKKPSTQQIAKENKAQVAKDKEMPDRFEAQRDWGTKILSDHDPAWRDPQYLERLREFAVPNITNYGGKATELVYEHQTYLRNFFPGDVKNFTSNGTDANNMLFLYAKAMLERRTGKPANEMKFLSFADIYGGSYGPILKLHDSVKEQYGMKNKDQLPSPFIIPGKKLTREELVKLEKVENEALRQIESQIKDAKNQVGAIFMESIPAAKGVKMFRTEFVLKLRELADQYSTPIFADEILTGGGRTGKFWAFQHYEGFVPDLVTFGKGLAISGIFAPERHSRISSNLYIDYAPPPTTAVNPLALLQSIQVVKNVWERRLDLNAAEAGAYMMQKTLKAIAVKEKETGSKIETGLPLAGVGLLITGFPSYHLNTKSPTETSYTMEAGYNYRILPVLTTTKEDINWVIQTHLGWKLD